MAKILEEQVMKALDECAPMKEFKIRKNNTFGLNEETIKLIKERDSIQKKIEKASETEKEELQTRYKKIRNAVVNKVRQETIDYNDERIKKARDENVLWKVVN